MFFLLCLYLHSRQKHNMFSQYNFIIIGFNIYMCVLWFTAFIDNHSLLRTILIFFNPLILCNKIRFLGDKAKRLLSLLTKILCHKSDSFIQSGALYDKLISWLLAIDFSRKSECKISCVEYCFISIIVHIQMWWKMT